MHETMEMEELKKFEINILEPLHNNFKEELILEYKNIYDMYASKRNESKIYEYADEISRFLGDEDLFKDEKDIHITLRSKVKQLLDLDGKNEQVKTVLLNLKPYVDLIKDEDGKTIDDQIKNNNIKKEQNTVKDIKSSVKKLYINEQKEIVQQDKVSIAEKNNEIVFLENRNFFKKLIYSIFKGNIKVEVEIKKEEILEFERKIEEIENEMSGNGVEKNDYIEVINEDMETEGFKSRFNDYARENAINTAILNVKPKEDVFNLQHIDMEAYRELVDIEELLEEKKGLEKEGQ